MLACKLKWRLEGDQVGFQINMCFLISDNIGKPPCLRKEGPPAARASLRASVRANLRACAWVWDCRLSTSEEPSC